MALSQSLNKLILKFGENVNKTQEKKSEDARPSSPFVLLLSEGEEEFNFNPNPGSPVKSRKHDDNDVFDHDSMGSSLRLDSSCGNTSAEGENIGYESSGIASDATCEGQGVTVREVHIDSSFENDDLSMADDNLTDNEEVAMKENDELRSSRANPMTKTQFDNLFDDSGRLIREHELRRAIFKGGVDDSIRKEVWQFLFELYPFNTTSREREVLKVEQTLRYEAMKIRWKNLLKTLVNEYEGVRYCPKWYSACPENAKEHVELLTKSQASLSVNIVEESLFVIDNVKTEEVKLRLMSPKDTPIDENINNTKDNSDIELKSFGLVCQEHEEEEILNQELEEFCPSSYEEKVSQIHCLSRPRENSDVVVKVEMADIHGIQGNDETEVDQTTENIDEENAPPVNFVTDCSDFQDEKTFNKTKERATSVKFECSEVDDIRTALADAMLDVPNTCSPSKEESSASNTACPMEDFDILNSDSVPRSNFNTKVNKQQDSVIDPTSNKPSSIESVQSNTEPVIFPNPFTLPPEYINNQESLYSQSENFQSLDIANLKTDRSQSVEVAEVAENSNQSISVKVDEIELNKDTQTIFLSSPFPENRKPVETAENLSNCNSKVDTNMQVNIDANSNKINIVDDDSDNQLLLPEQSLDEIDSKNTFAPIGNENKPDIASEVNTTSADCIGNTVDVACDENVLGVTATENPDMSNKNNESNAVSAKYTEIVSEENTSDRASIKIMDVSGDENTLGMSITENAVVTSDKNVSVISPTENTLDVTGNENNVRILSTCSNDIHISNSDDELNNAEVERLHLQSNNKSLITPSRPIDIGFKSLASLRDDSPDSLWTPIKKLSVGEARIPASKSPTGESVEHLPPWIAQMIQASTPSSPEKTRCRRSRTNSTPSSISMTKNSNSKSPPTKGVMYDEEILGIVESANKYLEKQAKAHSGRSTPKQNNVQKQMTDNVKKELDKTKSSPSIRPASCQDIDSFMNVTPKFKFVPHTFDCNDGPVNDKEDTVFQDCPYCSFNSQEPPQIVLETSLGEEQLKFMEIQAHVYAARQNYSEKLISASIRVIDKDVPRTDRELPQFSGDDNPGLIKLRDSLLTYAFFHPEVGYAQGMNDIMSRFLIVMDTEAEAFWMFVNYMEHFKNDFMEEGMLRKVALVEQLLMKMDRELYDYLQNTDMGLMFCHRWLLLNFKREFDYSEAIRLFEITSSRHLEVSSVEAELERSKERAKEFVKDNAGSHLEEIYLSPEYPFDIFVCVAMLMECRHMIMDTVDLTAVYQILSNLPTTLDLTNVLRKSEELFYRYCRKTVVDCFQVIDELEVEDYHRKKNPFSFAFR